MKRATAIGIITTVLGLYGAATQNSQSPPANPVSQTACEKSPEQYQTGQRPQLLFFRDQREHFFNGFIGPSASRAGGLANSPNTVVLLGNKIVRMPFLRIASRT